MLNIYKASAGSGKTFNLAYEYIKLLLGRRDPSTGRLKLNRRSHNSHRQILAITFTVKATEEMKQRIVHELAVLAGAEPGWTEESPYKEKLLKELNCSEEELREAAESALRALLLDYGFFSISTIDSFFQSVLRTFAREAELTGNYDVELDDTMAVVGGVRELINSINEVDTKMAPEELRRLKTWLFQYMKEKINTGKKFNFFDKNSGLFEELVGFVKRSSDEKFLSDYDRIMEYLRDMARITRFAAQMNERRRELLEPLPRLLDETREAVAASGLVERDLIGKNPFSLLNKPLEELLKYDTQSKSTFKKAVADPLSFFKKKYKPGSEPRVEELLSRLFPALQKAGREIETIANSTSTLYQLGLLGYIYNNIERYREENDTILLKDTTSLLNAIIGEEDAPFIYERMGQWISHFLIDEFQDTSRLQWKNILPLLRESLAYENENLIIGDEKQSIYRFRGSDSTLLRDIEKTFKGRTRGLNDSLEGNTNWRSSAEVVRANNTLFSAMARLLGFKDIYNNVTQPISKPHASHPGYVKFTRIVESEKPKKEVALELLVKDIRRQLDNGYRPGDIAVLVHRNTDGATVINTLMASREELGLPDLRIVSDDSLRISSSPTVRLIVSVLRFLAMRERTADEVVEEERQMDARNLYEAKGLSEIARLINRYEFCLTEGKTPGEALHDALHDEDLEIETIAEDAERMRCSSLQSLVERIIPRYIPRQQLEDENLYIAAFQDLVSEFVSRGTTDLRSFLQFWDAKGKTAVVAGPEDADALRVMTIHKSKGLEFKCVHIPFFDRTLINFQSAEWFDAPLFEGIAEEDVPPLIPIKPAKWMEESPYAAQYAEMVKAEMLDRLNVCYVALTRAVDELCVTYDIPKEIDKDFKDTSQVLDAALRMADSRFVESLREENPEVASLSVDPYVPLTPTGEGSGLILTEIGRPTTRREEKAKARTALEPNVEPTIMEPYTTADRDDLWAYTKIDDLPDFSAARDRGVILHRLLGRVRRPGDLEKAVATMVRRHELPADEADGIEDFLARELQREDVRPWFEGYRSVAIERSIVLGDGTARRPDRIVWREDGGVDVVDYKFGEKESRYAGQVRRYMNLLRRAGYTDVRGYLWYVASGEVLEVE